MLAVSVQFRLSQIQWNHGITNYQWTAKQDRYNGVVTSGCFSLHFTITGLKNMDRHIGVFNEQGFVISGFHCSGRGDRGV